MTALASSSFGASPTDYRQDAFSPMQWDLSRVVDAGPLGFFSSEQSQIKNYGLFDPSEQRGAC